MLNIGFDNFTFINYFFQCIYFKNPLINEFVTKKSFSNRSTNLKRI